MASIFICYRRKDVPVHAARLHGDLKRRFGADRVFIDTAAIAPGLDFREAIQQTLGRIQVMLVVIGPAWNSLAKGSERPLSDPNDYVRLEVGSALSRNLRIIPVLMAGADLPTDDVLPTELKPLQFRQALRFSDDPAYWDFDVDRLTVAIQHATDASPEVPPLTVSPPPTGNRGTGDPFQNTHSPSHAASSGGEPSPRVQTAPRETISDHKRTTEVPRPLPAPQPSLGQAVVLVSGAGLILVWLLGVVSSYTLGGFVHVLLIAGILLLIARAARRAAQRKPRSGADR